MILIISTHKLSKNQKHINFLKKSATEFDLFNIFFYFYPYLPFY